MSMCITQAGEALIASLQAQGLPLVIDTMIFANVPGLDPAQSADRAQAVPTVNIVHSAEIPPEFRSFVNPNQVVYSVLLGSDVGDFTFNWQGLYCSAHQTLIAVAELPAIEKRANDAGTNTPGNNLTRNFMLQFSGAQALTGLTVEAEVWQLDFTLRLKGIDERERLSNRDTYGRAAFLDDGWLLVNVAGSYHFTPGTGYVEGIRAALPNQIPAVPGPLPCDVYLDVCQAPQGSDVVTLVTPRFVAQGTGLPDYAEGAPFHTSHYCVQVAHVAADGTITDMRPKEPEILTQVWAALNAIEIPAATETVAGILKLGTQELVDAGVDDTSAVTSKKLAVRLAAIPAPAVVTGASRNLVISSTGTSAAVTLTADELVLKDASGKSILLSNVALSADLIAANIDTGAAVKASTWYARWVFAKADRTAVLRFSESSTAPTLPAGYTYKALVGQARTDATANVYPLGVTQRGHRSQYLVNPAGNVPILPLVASGILGSLTTPTYIATSVSPFVPPTATAILLCGSTGGTIGGTWAIAPNPNYGAPNSAARKPPAVVTIGSGSGQTYAATVMVNILLEAMAIYVASDNTSNQLAAFGWEDA